MPDFYDLCLREASGEMEEFARELGWEATNCSISTVFLEAENWGELKDKIKSSREEADVLVFQGGDEKLNRKAAGDTRIDILLHPEKGRKDSGVDHIIAEKASENRVALGLDLSSLKSSRKKSSHILNHWRRNLKLAEKYSTSYLITTGAEQQYELRAPRDLASLIDSLGYAGKEAVSDTPRKILERRNRIDGEGFVRPGVTKV